MYSKPFLFEYIIVHISNLCKNKPQDTYNNSVYTTFNFQSEITRWYTSVYSYNRWILWLDTISQQVLNRLNNWSNNKRSDTSPLLNCFESVDHKPGPPRARIGPRDRWDRGSLNVSDDWKEWRFETIFYTRYCNMILCHTNKMYWLFSIFEFV